MKVRKNKESFETGSETIDESRVALLSSFDDYEEALRHEPLRRKQEAQTMLEY